MYVLGVQDIAEIIVINTGELGELRIRFGADCGSPLLVPLEGAEWARIFGWFVPRGCGSGVTTDLLQLVHHCCLIVSFKSAFG